MPKEKNKRQKVSYFNYKTNSYIMLLACAAISTVIGVSLYNQTKIILEGRLKERIVSIVSTGVLQFNPVELSNITADSVGSENYIQIVRKLQQIRNVNKNVHFAYLLKPTSDVNTHTFIADADSMDPNAQIDLNQDGVIDEEDGLVAPEDPYDVSEIPALRDDAMLYPTTDESLISDQWGATISAYAPIMDMGKTVAILGIDVEVTDFLELISETFLPFALFIIFLLLVLTILTVFLMKVWQQRVDAVEDLDRQKDELLGIVTHQLAKPVTAIRWNLESMLDGDEGELKEEQKKEMVSMHKMAIDLADLVSMILDVSRVQLGRLNMDPQALPLKDFFDEMIAVIKPTIQQKKIKFNENVPATLPTVLLDKRYTRMTIENLLTNAAKYTPEGGTVTFDIQIKDGVMHGKIADSGCGIPKAEQDKIFGKMYRATNVRNTAEGNGFGLYVAKGAIEGQGGKLWFESEEGKGTTFYFELPMKTAPQKSKAA